MDIEEKKNEFLYNSITDFQSTIRAIDIKMSFLLVILLIFISKINTINTIIISLVCLNGKIENITYLIIGILFTMFWGIAFISALRVLIPISNPCEHITGGELEGYFYPAFLYKIKWLYAIFYSEAKSSKSIDEYVNMLPKNQDEITKQLAFEQMKLLYILEFKLKRSKLAFYFTTVWVFLGCVIWICYILK